MATSGLYGVSIQHLRDKGAVPGIGRYQPRLNLSYKNIDYLDGLGEVRNIERARIVRLDNNDLTSIPEGSLAAVENNLQVLNLSNNKLTTEGLQGLSGLKNLRALILNSNNIEDIPQEVLDGLPKLIFISLYGNPISVEKINQLRHQGYYVSTWSITRANLRKAGLVAGALAGLVISAVGTVKFVKSKTDARISVAIADEIREKMIAQGIGEYTAFKYYKAAASARSFLQGGDSKREEIFYGGEVLYEVKRVLNYLEDQPQIPPTHLGKMNMDMKNKLRGAKEDLEYLKLELEKRGY